jgi:hypothetical protein
MNLCGKVFINEIYRRSEIKYISCKSSGCLEFQQEGVQMCMQVRVCIICICGDYMCNVYGRSVGMCCAVHINLTLNLHVQKRKNTQT